MNVVEERRPSATAGWMPENRPEERLQGLALRRGASQVGEGSPATPTTKPGDGSEKLMLRRRTISFSSAWLFKGFRTDTIKQIPRSCASVLL